MPATGTRWQLDGHSVRVSSLDRPYWPDDGLTKGDLLAYYRDLAPVLLPYFEDRPVTARLFPRGITGPSHYRREIPETAPDWVRSAEYHAATDGHAVRVLLVDDAAGLVWLANSGAIELHLWGARLPDLGVPDMAIFDLDPGDKASFADVLKAARILLDRLDGQKLCAYPKTTGGDGIHVFVPLAAGHTFEQVRDWVREQAEALADKHPGLFAVARGSTHRGTHVTVDHAQNSIGRNTAAPYTVRGRPGAPVSTPVTRDEIEAGTIRPSDFTLRTVPERLDRLGDLFAPVLKGGQRL
jgi:bifunctional non-homologous end joining protein LigD